MRKTPQSPIATVRSIFTEIRVLFERRKEELGYSSLSDYFFWMAVYDVLLRRPHRFSSYLAQLPTDRQEEAIKAVIEDFDNPKKPGALFEARVYHAAREETWRLHAEIRELKDRVRELERELAREKAQGKFA